MSKAVSPLLPLPCPCTSHYSVQMFLTINTICNYLVKCFTCLWSDSSTRLTIQWRHENSLFCPYTITKVPRKVSGTWAALDKAIPGVSKNIMPVLSQRIDPLIMIIFAIENKSVKERIRTFSKLEVWLHVPQPEIYMIKLNYQVINYKSFPSWGTINVLLFSTSSYFSI